MRVLFVNENIGGHVTTHLHLRRALADHPEVDARFLDVPPAGPVRRALGASVPGLARADLDLQPLRAQLAASAWTRRHLARAMAGVDVVHVFTHNATLLSAARLAGVPCVVALDSTNEVNARSLPYRRPTVFTGLTVAATRPFERRVYGAADLVVATSEATARSLRDDYGVGADRIRNRYYGIGAPAFPTAAAPGTTPAPGALPRIVWVGRSLERKGGEQLLRVHRRHLRDVCELVMITPEPVRASPGTTVVDDLRPGDGRLWELLRSAAAFVFPSDIDQQPNAVMEAMAAGLPVVGHPVNAVAEMIVDGETGTLLGDASDATLAAAIRGLVADPERCTAAGAASRTRYEKLFDAAVTTPAVLDVLREAIDRHGHRDDRAPGRPDPG